MKYKKTNNFSLHVSILILLVTLVVAPLKAQNTSDLNALRGRVGELMDQQKYTEALPLLEKIAAANPNDGQAQFLLGFALLGQAKNTNEKEVIRQLMIRARKSFVRAKELGVRESILDALIASIPQDGNIENSFSKNAEADKLMQEGEALFTQGKIDDALAAYQKALKLDPTIYEAALFAGDMYMRKDDFANAEIWYQKAIAIDPNRETAYRYSATPLMKQRKYDAARDRYIEAYIVEPYNRFSAVGLSQWAQAVGANLGHPKIDIPEVKEDDKGNLTGNISLGGLLGGASDDGSTAWMSYIATRSIWRKEKFAKTFPNEKTYRHTLAEELDALRSVLTLLDVEMKKKKIKNLSQSLTNLKKLNDAGLLEAYILFAQADEGIAQDYQSYLKQNRDKLRRYTLEYVVQK